FAAASVPGAPLGLMVTNGNASLSLTWGVPPSDGGSPITGYNVYRGTGNYGSETFLTQIGPAVSPADGYVHYTDTGLTNRGVYIYRIAAVNAVGVGPYGSECWGMPAAPAAVPPSPPVLSASASASNIALSWTVPTNDGGASISGYRVYRSTTSGAETSMAALG